MFRRYVIACVIFAVLATGLAVTAVVLGESQSPPTRAEQRLKLAQEANDAINAMSKARENASSEQVYRWSRRLMEAEEGISDKKVDQVAAINAYLLRMKAMEQRLSQAYRQGEASYLDDLEAQWYVLEAELLLARAQGEHAER